jgi:hypothetical protein
VRPTLLLALLVSLLLGAACAHRPLAVVLSFAACPVAGGGSDVTANVSSDVAPATRPLARDHFPGACAIESAPGGLPALACAGSPVDTRYVLAWTRPAPRTLVLERREYPVSRTGGAPESTTPAVRRAVAELAIDRQAWISAPPRSTCEGAP